MMVMPNTFETLAGFLARCDEEVEGRESAAPPAEIVALMRNFARGQLASAGQAELVSQLSAHPDWIAALAAEVKALRTVGDSP